MLKAWKEADGTYRITSDYAYETYTKRNHFRNLGAQWRKTGLQGHWFVTEEQRQLLHIPRMIRVSVTDCHETNSQTMVTEDKAIVGNRIDCFCGMCDSHYTGTILAIIE